MPLQRSSNHTINLRDAGFALAWLLALILLIPIQLASIIVFDSTGLDILMPDLVFTAVVPALVLILPPTLIARRLYTHQVTRVTAAVAFTAFALIAAYTMQFYGMCGAGC